MKGIEESYYSSGSPYQLLHIYYLKGSLIAGELNLGNNFIGNWEEDGFSFLFFSKPSPGKVEDLLNEQPHLEFIDKYNMTYEDWHGEKIKPLRVGNFLISPPWDLPEENNEKNDGELRIILDPGVVFGTGTHTTTHDCLEAIEIAFNSDKIETAIDIGTGTGLLGIAAARIGCKKTLALDFNYLASKTALRNVRLNYLQDRIIVVQGMAEDFIDTRVDLLVTNIHYDVMKKLIISDGFLFSKFFILSGLMRSQARVIADILDKLPVEIIKTWERDGIWNTFLGKVLPDKSN
ncbi:MAG: methyltransferase [Desulfobacterales bacterium]|jgi:ribosomal protein L11 methyltransferase|nr:methyltransferase [Desulfobacteraceae bacterium]MBT4365101.1 methyltransferase [Desulfobacteraceae bacterium]MBT7085602.1 methyltransferase [Desulfobacterales bacterium]